LSWEYWRVAYGYAGKSNFFSVVTFSGFLVLAFIVAAVASLWLRLEFILERCAASYGLYRGVAILMASIFVCVTWLSFALFAKQRSKSWRVFMTMARSDRLNPATSIAWTVELCS